MKTLFVFSITIVVLLVVIGCGSSPSEPAVGTVEGKVRFNREFASASVHLCKVTEYSPDTSVVATDIDWSGIVSDGWSLAEGFKWQGDVHAPGFTCTLVPNLKFELRQIAIGDEKPFSISNVPPGKFAIVVILHKPMGGEPQLIYHENNIPKVIDLISEHGIDIGLLTLSNE